jgi:hypothetical protein
MSHKRTKKDVEEAYRRGFQAGFNVRPNPLAMILRSIWRKHEQKKLRKAWEEEVKNNRIHSRTIGFVKNIREDEHGLNAEIVFNDDVEYKDDGPY